MIRKITLVPDTITSLLNEEVVKGFEGWTLESDTDSGEFDSEKGAMYDYKLTLIDPDGNMYIGRGGYYTGPTGEVFHEDIEFTPKKKRTKNEDKEYKLYLKLKEKYE